jgi:hypothetical protein
MPYSAAKSATTRSHLTPFACHEIARLIREADTACRAALGPNLVASFGSGTGPQDVRELEHLDAALLKHGFVMDDADQSRLPDLDRINADAAVIDQMSLEQVRLLLHHLQKAEKWADSFGFNYLAAIRSGALQAVARRLDELADAA